MFCLDKPKFGGRNKKKGACLERKCLNLSLANTKVTPAQSGLSHTGPQSEGPTMTAENRNAVKHDHCYSMNKAASEKIELWCYESLEEFIAETLEVQLQKPSIRIILGKGCENQEELDFSENKNLTAVLRGVISREKCSDQTKTNSEDEEQKEF